MLRNDDDRDHWANVYLYNLHKYDTYQLLLVHFHSFIHILRLNFHAEKILSDQTHTIHSDSNHSKMNVHLPLVHIIYTYTQSIPTYI